MNFFGDLGFVGTIGTAWLIADWVIRIAALFIVPKNRKPTAGMAWLLFIFLFPLPGLVIFILLGSPKLPKARREAQKKSQIIIKKRMKE